MSSLTRERFIEEILKIAESLASRNAPVPEDDEDFEADELAEGRLSKRVDEILAAFRKIAIAVKFILLQRRSDCYPDRREDARVAVMLSGCSRP